jgi:hypothetical protein
MEDRGREKLKTRGLRIEEKFAKDYGTIYAWRVLRPISSRCTQRDTPFIGSTEVVLL